MLFSLEALSAKHGDALLLLYGDPTRPKIILIDGGPSGVYGETLRGRLEALRANTGKPVLPIRLVMVSHLDDDHINGILSFIGALYNSKQDLTSPEYKIEELWHNSFDDLLKTAQIQVTGAGGGSVLQASLEGGAAFGVKPSECTSAILASVGQGRTLRDQAKYLNIPVNKSAGAALVVAPKSGLKELRIDDEHDVSFRVLGPNIERITKLQKEWDKTLKKKGWTADKKGKVAAAAYVDESVFNLSSIVVLAQCNGKTILLTGDARGDLIVDGLRSAGLLKNGAFHVDLLKVPHHGSDRNVEQEFFEKITADHYVISGDGKYDNPSTKTLQWIVEARGKSKCTIHLTNKVKSNATFLEKAKNKNPNLAVVYRPSADPSVVVNLGSPLGA